MLKVTSEWTGFLGGPGYTNFYFDGLLEGGTQAQQKADLVRSFWEALKSMLPAVVNIRVNPTVAQLNPANGQLTSEQSITTPPVATQGTAINQYAAVAGFCMGWQTNGIVGGKRVRGRTFIVPAAFAAFEANGTLSPAALTAANTAAGILIAPPLSAGSDFGIWKRPVNGAGGSWHKVVAGRTVDKAAYLRSRRD